MGSPFETGIFNQGDDSNAGIDNGGGSGYAAQQEQGNPNWQGLLADIPQDLHAKVLPHLQQWDQNINKRFEAFAPWNPVIKSGATPDVVQTGLNIVNLLERDPEALWKALGDNYKFGQQQEQQQPQDVVAQQEQQQQQELRDPRYDQLEQNFQTLAGHLLDMKKQEQEAQAEMLVKQEFDQAHKKLGEFDDNWVRAQCIANPQLSVEAAGKAYQEWHRAELAKYGARPLISGSSNGSVPGQHIDPRKLNDKDARALGVDMLLQAKRNQF